MKVGFTTVDITPPPGFGIPGDFMKRFFYDIHDPLHAKVVVFEWGNLCSLSKRRHAFNKGFYSEFWKRTRREDNGHQLII